MPLRYFENICTQVIHAHLRRSGCTWQTTAVNAACSSQGSSQTAIRQMGSVRVGKVMNEACSVTTLAFPATPIQHAWNLSLPWGTIRIEIFPPPTFGDFVHLASPANMDYLSSGTPVVSFTVKIGRPSILQRAPVSARYTAGTESTLVLRTLNPVLVPRTLTLHPNPVA